MGTAGLVIGIGLIIFGFFFVYYGLFEQTSVTIEDFTNTLLGSLFIGIILIITGGLFLVKHDREKKNQSLVSTQTLKGVGIGITASVIIWVVYAAAINQIFVMTNDAMEPTIMVGDVMHYAKTPFNQISVNDLILYKDSADPSRVLAHKVIQKDILEIKVKNEISPATHTVTEDQYIGKITSIHTWGPPYSIVLTPFSLILLMIASFVSPIVIMKITRQEKSENS